MSWKKCGAQVKIAFAIVVVALFTGGWSEGRESGIFSTIRKIRDRQNEGIGARSDANRSAQDASSAQIEVPDTSIKIDIGPRGVAFNGRGMSFEMLDDNVKKLAASSPKSIVLVRCTLDSPHGFLIRVLDICHKYKMYNLSILSM